MYSFSIIILNWNGIEHLKIFLPSVAASNYPEYEIILADNNSEDESVGWVNEHYPAIKIVRFDENYGYCKGNNKAAECVAGNIIVFLNNDVKVHPDWLRHVNDTFERFSGTAVVQPKLLSYKQPEYFEYAGAAGGMLDRLGYPWCRGRIFDRLEKDSGQYDEYPSKIFWASGAAFCIKKDVFKNSGGFDEHFEFHMEEIDLCWRLQNKGYDIRYCPDAVVWHLGGGSLFKSDSKKTYFNFRNNLAMLTKNYPQGSLPGVLILRFFLDFLAALSFLLGGKVNHSNAVFKAYSHFYRKFSAWLKTRKEIDPPSTVNLAGFKPFSILWQKIFNK